MIIKKKFSRVDFYNININNNNNINNNDDNNNDNDNNSNNNNVYVGLIQFFHLRSPMMR